MTQPTVTAWPAPVWITDPGHGWLKVPAVEVAGQGIEESISGFSHLSEGYAYLEKDCDASVYLESVSSDATDFPETHGRWHPRNLPPFTAAGCRVMAERYPEPANPV